MAYCVLGFLVFGWGFGACGFDLLRLLWYGSWVSFVLWVSCGGLFRLLWMADALVLWMIMVDGWLFRVWWWCCDCAAFA